MNVRHFRDHVLPDQLPGELTGGATFSLINSLESLQVESPPPWSTPWRAYRWSHLLPDQLPGGLTGGATSSLINSLEGLQVEPPPPWSTPWRAYRLSHLLPDQLGELTGPKYILCSIPSNNCLQCCHTNAHSLMAGWCTVVGRIGTGFQESIRDIVFFDIRFLLEV